METVVLQHIILSNTIYTEVTVKYRDGCVEIRDKVGNLLVVNKKEIPNLIKLAQLVKKSQKIAAF